MKKITLSIRIPLEYKRYIQKEADNDLRSFNNQITLILSRHIKSIENRLPTDQTSEQWNPIDRLPTDQETTS